MTSTDELRRDPYIDVCRAFSLCVVVIWHWVFTIISWESDGPHASNPIGYTAFLWPLTWLLQVLPLFFFVGGFAHQTTWNRLRARGGTYGQFLAGRLRRLLLPSAALLATWIVLGTIGGTLAHKDHRWITRMIVLAVSPLWFMAVYILLVAVAPLMLWLHRRGGPLVLVTLVGIAGLVDVFRFARHVEWVSYINLAVVWALCHQLGFFYDRLVRSPMTTRASLAVGGFAGLMGLVATGLYPGSMVGVPGGRISNMGPPTLCIVALCFFQAGVALLLRPWVMDRIDRRRWRRANDLMTRVALPLFLFHSTGMAAGLTVVHAVFDYVPPNEPTWRWWAERPLWLALSLVFTLPIIVAFGRRRPAPAGVSPAG